MWKESVDLDADGVMIDSNEESDELVRNSWLKIMHEPYPIPKDGFRYNIRPFIVTPHDFYSFTRAYLNNENFTTVEGADAVRERYDDLANAGMDAYMKERAILSKDMDKWMSLLPPFEGVGEMIRELNSMPVNVFVVSSKDNKSISAFLEYNGFSVDAIFDKSLGKGLEAEVGGGRRKQFEALKRMGYSPERAVVYDDARENLLVAKEWGMYPIAAPQGYDTVLRLHEFVKAYPREFPGVVEELLGL